MLFDAYSRVYDWSQPMYEALVSSYKSILGFWKNAAKIFTRKSVNPCDPDRRVKLNL